MDKRDPETTARRGKLYEQMLYPGERVQIDVGLRPFQVLCKPPKGCK